MLVRPLFRDDATSAHVDVLIITRRLQCSLQIMPGIAKNMIRRSPGVADRVSVLAEGRLLKHQEGNTTWRLSISTTENKREIVGIADPLKEESGT
jgi:hypothetical protein